MTAQGDSQLDEAAIWRLQEKYIAEMTLPNKLSDKEWAAKNGTSARSVRRWKQKKSFGQRQKEWVQETHFNPSKMGAIWSNLSTIASTEKGPHAVSAAKIIADQAALWDPPKPKIDAGPADFVEMDDQQVALAAAAIGMKPREGKDFSKLPSYEQLQGEPDEVEDELWEAAMADDNEPVVEPWSIGIDDYDGPGDFDDLPDFED